MSLKSGLIPFMERNWFKLAIIVGIFALTYVLLQQAAADALKRNRLTCSQLQEPTRQEFLNGDREAAAMLDPAQTSYGTTAHLTASSHYSSSRQKCFIETHYDETTILGGAFSERTFTDIWDGIERRLIESCQEIIASRPTATVTTIPRGCYSGTLDQKYMRN
jgi:hypothetical protein